MIVRLFAVAIPTLGALGFASFSHVAAHPACSDRTVEGDYALHASGLTEDLTHHTANLGRIVVDGTGRLSGELTVSVNGRIATAQMVRGTYSVNDDCTGSESFTVGADPTVRTATFVTANGGREIDFLETDAATVFNGTATRH